MLRRGVKVHLLRDTTKLKRLMIADGAKISRNIIKHVTGLPIYGEVYRKACEILGVKGSAELAILTLELLLHTTTSKIEEATRNDPWQKWREV